MRALYLPKLSPTQDIVQIDGEDFTHLVHVTRIEVGEALRIIFGEGKSALAEVFEIKKKALLLKMGEVTHSTRPFVATAFVGTVKKEAMAEVIKLATELMISELNFIETEYSQRQEMNAERVEKLIKSAVEQSNNFFPPKVEMGLKWEEALSQLKEHELIFFMHKGAISQPKRNFKDSMRDFTLLLGPEGGFSPIEVKDILELSPIAIDLPTAILRTPSALGAGMGWVLSQNCH
jgi:16S rRNA (uracil1498-N3)-methyltransferase